MNQVKVNNIGPIVKHSHVFLKSRGMISSVGKAFDCRVGGRGFDSQGPTITQGLKITEK